MIKVKKGTAELSGAEPELVLEFTVMACAMREHLTNKHDEEYADKVIATAIEDSKKAEKELALCALESIIKILNMALKESDERSEEDAPLDKPSTGNPELDAIFERVFGGGAK